MNNLLNEAQKILGQPVRVEEHRGWAVFWCPFHDDAARAGRGGRPNLGVNIHSRTGYWKCLRCGESGPSLAALRRKLGMPRPRPVTPHRETRSRVTGLDEALAEARAALLRSPGWAYIQKRGIRPHTALTYGLGYGVPTPKVHRDTLEIARGSRLVARDGHWLWAGGVVYADPLNKPITIQVRHLRRRARKKYQTWGRLIRPLGAWRLKASTQIAVVAEGLFDMLTLAQALHDRGREEVIPVYTGGAAVSWAMRWWFQEHNQYGYVLVPDPDEAGKEWAKSIRTAIRKGNGVSHTVHPPEGLDPDEAILDGWWPEGI
ncbi:MAG: toprim domain-containing protein [Anaerolineales bacterium]